MSTGVPSKSRLDVYQAITDKIIAAIEAGAGPYVMPWHTAGVRLGRPENVTTGKRYRGVNVVALWAEAVSAGFGSGAWASYRQWQSIGAQVRSGEHGALIVFYQSLDRKEEAVEQDDTRDAPRFVARASYVFNAAQVEGWQPSTARDAEIQPLETVDDFIKLGCVSPRAAASKYPFATGSTASKVALKLSAVLLSLFKEFLIGAGFGFICSLQASRENISTFLARHNNRCVDVSVLWRYLKISSISSSGMAFTRRLHSSSPSRHQVSFTADAGLKIGNFVRAGMR